MLEGPRVSPDERTDDIELWLSSLGPSFFDNSSSGELRHPENVPLRNPVVVKLCPKN